MKTAIKAALSLMMMIAVATVSAQTPSRDHSPEERAKMMTERLKKELGLSQEQADQMMKLNLQAMQTRMPKDSVERKKMMDMRTAEIKKILTPEQFTKWEQMQKAMMDRMRQMGPGPQTMTPEQMTAYRVERMKKELKLNDQQADQIKKMYMDGLKQMQGKDKEAWKELAKAQDAQLKTILTPEQYAKWEQIRKERNDQRSEGERYGRKSGDGKTNEKAEADQ